jgi:hypothetical protein
VLALGPQAVIGGAEGVAARRVTPGPIARGPADVAGATAQPAPPVQRRELQTFHGELESTRAAHFAGFDDEHLLAMVKLDDGRTAAVDLGPSADLERVTLTPGAPIEFRAQDGEINSAPGLVATEVALGGARLILRQPDIRAAAPSRRAAAPGGLDAGGVNERAAEQPQR